MKKTLKPLSILVASTLIAGFFYGCGSSRMYRPMLVQCEDFEEEIEKKEDVNTSSDSSVQRVYIEQEQTSKKKGDVKDSKAIIKKDISPYLKSYFTGEHTSAYNGLEEFIRIYSYDSSMRLTDYFIKQKEFEKAYVALNLMLEKKSVIHPDSVPSTWEGRHEALEIIYDKILNDEKLTKADLERQKMIYDKINLTASEVLKIVAPLYFNAYEAEKKEFLGDIVEELFDSPHSSNLINIDERLGFEAYAKINDEQL